MKKRRNGDRTHSGASSGRLSIGDIFVILFCAGVILFGATRCGAQTVETFPSSSFVTRLPSRSQAKAGHSSLEARDRADIARWLRQYRAGMMSQDELTSLIRGRLDLRRYDRD